MLLPVRLRLECVKSTDATTPVHLTLRNESSLCSSYVAEHCVDVCPGGGLEVLAEDVVAMLCRTFRGRKVKK